MKKRICVLDCTLRDGGYCNEWRFGYKNIKKIINGIVETGIEIVECGFLTDKVDYNQNITKFTNLDQIKEFIPKTKKSTIFVAMINYGEYDVENLPLCDGTSITGIRVAFHKKDRVEAIEFCKKINEKGYKVFVQAMVTLSYTDQELLEMVSKVNEFEPYAFYIVDSFGEMKKNNLVRVLYLIDFNLDKNIRIGFHSHNNLQLSYSNAQTLVDMRLKRELIIDASVYGMGRGAGNLNSELFVEYLNDYTDNRYELKPLLIIIDEILNEFYQQNYWGYSLPNYISASHHAHPNYALYLDEKKTLTVDNMNSIFDMMDEEKRVTYDKNYIEELYIKYMATGKTHEEHKAEVQNKLKGKKVLLIAAGKSSVDEKNAIIDFSKANDVITISINYDYEFVQTEYIFVSNLRRYREIRDDARMKCIVTSNISADGVYLQTNYQDLLFSDETVKDNAGVMAIKYFSRLGVNDIYLAGFDGYAHDVNENFVNEDMSVIIKNAVMDATNESMIRALKELKRNVNIVFLTKPKYIDI